MEIARVKDGVIRYALEFIAPKMDSKGQFMLGAAAALLAGRAEGIVRQIAETPAVKMMGIIDGDSIDVDALFDAMMAQMQRQDRLVLDVSLLGRMTFDAQDLRDLYQCIKGA